jgi:hypothetical protein
LIDYRREAPGAARGEDALADSVITKYCLEVKFDGLDQEMFFEVEKEEYERVKAKCDNLAVPRDFLFLTTSDNSEILLCLKNVATIHFLFESSLEDIPVLRLVKEESWVIKYRLRDRPEPEYISVTSPRKVVEAHAFWKRALEAGSGKGSFYMITDGDGKDLAVNLRKLLYLAIPQSVIVAGKSVSV